MAKLTVHLRPLITVEVDDADPLSAARYARDRLLGWLRESPVGVMSVGYMPNDPWSVHEGRRLVASGVDNDLFPRETLRRCAHGHGGCCGHHDQNDDPIHAPEMSCDE